MTAAAYDELIARLTKWVQGVQCICTPRERPRRKVCEPGCRECFREILHSVGQEILREGRQAGFRGIRRELEALYREYQRIPTKAAQAAALVVARCCAQVLSYQVGTQAQERRQPYAPSLTLTEGGDGGLEPLGDDAQPRRATP